ncbi:MAG TPA: phosphoribosylanthranilate isomerase [Acidobacteriaceae bacterium]
MWIKICGNTNLADAALAAELGADAVGFIFAESKRQVTAAQVAAITPHLPEQVERVGVFYTHDAAEIAQIATDAGLTAVQLQGGLDEDLFERLGEKLGDRIQIIQTLHWTIGEDAVESALAGQLQRIATRKAASRVLIDSKVGAAGGGTGVSYDWSAARTVFAAAPEHLRLIVAGGLKPENVADAIAQLRPWGVDVSSGVEVSARRKDPERLAQFIRNARATATP